MPRRTDTYARTLELANKWAAEGLAVGPAAIRAALGNTGSLSTITRALNDWRGDSPSSPSLESRKTWPSQSALDALAHQVGELQKTLQEAKPSTTASPVGGAELDAQIKAVIARFDGAQRHMLLQIEEARAEAAKWKARYEAAQKEAKTWRETLHSSTAQLREEVMWLRGKAGVEGSPPKLPRLETSSSFRAANQGAPVEAKYPGHPRAILSAPDEDAYE